MPNSCYDVDGPGLLWGVYDKMPGVLPFYGGGGREYKMYPELWTPNFLFVDISAGFPLWLYRW